MKILLILLLLLFGTYKFCQHQTKRLVNSTLEGYVDNEKSKYKKLNMAIEKKNPLIVHINVPNCPHTEKRKKFLKELPSSIKKRYFYEQLGNRIEFKSPDPMMYILKKCNGELCLFDPTSKKVKFVNARKLDQSQFNKEMEDFLK
jgi:hypothetical protein